eukprot:tig00000145_g8820.t1
MYLDARPAPPRPAPPRPAPPRPAPPARPAPLRPVRAFTSSPDRLISMPRTGFEPFASDQLLSIYLSSASCPRHAGPRPSHAPPPSLAPASPAPAPASPTPRRPRAETKARAVATKKFLSTMSHEMRTVRLAAPPAQSPAPTRAPPPPPPRPERRP